MRILQIANGYLRSKLYGHLFSHLESLGVEETVFVPVCKREKIQSYPENVFVVPCFRQLDRVLFFKKQRQMLAWLEANTDPAHVDVIHAHTVFSGGYAAMQLHKRYGIPYVVAVRNTDVNQFFRFMVHLRSVGVDVLRCAERVVFLSPAYQNDVINRWIPAEYRDEIRAKSVVIPNGIAPLFFEEFEVQKRHPEKSLRIVYAGDINANKNLELTVKAVSALRGQGIDVTITAVGEIQGEKYRKIVQNTAFLTHYPRCPQEELIRHLREADVFVMPSHTETFGLVYAEAMSQGLPVIYTAGQGFDGHFPEGTVGYAVCDTDVDDLVQKLLLVIERYDSLAAACPAAVQNFRWERIADVYKDMYHQLSERRRV